MDLICEVESRGVKVEWARLSRSKAGYQHSSRTIWMDNRLSSRPTEAVCALAHEYVHAMRGDDGPQPEWVEKLCDEAAAKMLISPAEYALTENVYGSHPAQLAVELGVTQQIITAYQRTLRVAA